MGSQPWTMKQHALHLFRNSSGVDRLDNVLAEILKFRWSFDVD
jgi:hypothetical protein